MCWEQSEADRTAPTLSEVATLARMRRNNRVQLQTSSGSIDSCFQDARTFLCCAQGVNVVASITLSDSQAKKRMRELWPVYAPKWLGSTGRWVRLLPFPVLGGPRQPYLHRPGGALITNPDGMFGAFGEHHVDLLVVEHCSTLQNFYDKRSRYTTSHDGLLLALPRPWREDWVGTIHGGRGGRQLEFGRIVELSCTSFDLI